jgi:RHS repeat-associated protein
MKLVALNSLNSLAIGYDQASALPNSETLGVVNHTISYSNFGEVSQIFTQTSNGSPFSETLTRDPLGRISSREEQLQGVSTNYVYSYDASGRLIQVQTNGVVTSTYAYDARNNRTSGTLNGQAITATYDNQDRLISYNGNSYIFDPNGQMIERARPGFTQKFAYDIFGQLKRTDVDASTIVEYLTDGERHRVGLKVNGNLLERYVYNERGQLIGRINSANQLSSFGYGINSNSPDMMTVGQNTFYVVKDHLGSIRFVINSSSGAIAQRIDYDEFGRVTNDTNPGFQPFGYAGGLYDYRTGLIRFGARDYDPETGRWTSKDPILFNGGDTNLYGYVMADPVNFIDPDGKNALAIALPYLAFEGGFFIGATINRLFFNIPYSQTYQDANPLVNFTDSLVPFSGFALDPSNLQTLKDIFNHNKRNQCGGT